MSLPTRGEEFGKIIEHLRKAQESMAMLAHLYRANDFNPQDRLMAQGWLAWSEQMGNLVKVITKFAKRGLQ